MGFSSARLGGLGLKRLHGADSDFSIPILRLDTTGEEGSLASQAVHLQPNITPEPIKNLYPKYPIRKCFGPLGLGVGQNPVLFQHRRGT